ncbi:AraC family transcriptional regulator [Egibacter rhizosphaerae]|uniref:AraC family transcriptional regulator n=1 Tax=Egibacter rhizosphaerae TaxID=1670831 RepID=A0A411YIF4_9ACTN|nr:helix-turn-helix domain-containing protein [Egibacter rhizosphaerae]QBI21048.1 AraC family transcriptional regulator [Egibacter rhizosphaerae]
MPVGELAAELGWSGRHLTRRFRQHVGLPPKRFARLVRFRRALALLEQADGPSPAEVALLAGYYDQAHLANEVRAMGGRTPAEIRGSVTIDPSPEEVAFVQDPKQGGS